MSFDSGFFRFAAARPFTCSRSQFFAKRSVPSGRALRVPRNNRRPPFYNLLLEAKTYGFSDFQIARAIGLKVSMNMERAALAIRKWRQELGIMPVVNQIDTLAAEYPAHTNYLYLSYL